MKIALPFFIAFRYVFSRQEQGFISFVSLVSWLGLILGVAAMIVVLSVMNGFDRELKHRILKLVPHGFVENISEEGKPLSWQYWAEQISQHEGIEAVAPVISDKVLVSFANKTVALDLQGIFPEREIQVSEIDKSLLSGSLMELKRGQYGIILGRVLAQQLGVNRGDSVQIILPDLRVSPVGFFARQKRFTVVGVFYVGASLDGQLALTDINSAARLFKQLERNGSPAVNRLRIKTSNIHQADIILASLKQSLLVDHADFMADEFEVSSWKDKQRVLFDAIKMERRVISLLLFIIIFVAVFNIASILVMMVSEKRSDMAILQVMGAGRKHIIGIFLIQGLLIGLLGIFFGILMGTAITYFLDDIIQLGSSVLHSSVGYTGYGVYLPTEYRIDDVILISVVSAFLCILAAVYPAWQAAKIDPVASLNE